MCTYNKSCNGNEFTDVEQSMLEQYVCKLISQSYMLDRGCGNLRTRITWYIFHCHLPLHVVFLKCILKLHNILGFIKSPS